MIENSRLISRVLCTHAHVLMICLVDSLLRFKLISATFNSQVMDAVDDWVVQGHEVPANGFSVHHIMQLRFYILG